MMTLVSEVLQTRKYTTGRVIMLQSRYSPTHTHYRKYYKARLSKFAEQIRSSKAKGETGRPSRGGSDAVTPNDTKRDKNTSPGKKVHLKQQ